jgi:hypothetical protein
MEQSTQQTDHDLLIGLGKDVQYMREELKLTRQEVNGKVSDHEGRIKAIEVILTQQTGALQARRNIGNAAKWAIGTLIGLLGVAITLIGLLIAQN